MIALLAGIAVIVAALGPWTDAAADRTLVAHMVQHMALTLVAAPLLVIGLSGRRLLRRLPRRVGRRLVRLASPLLAWVVFVGTQWATHFTGFYERAAQNGGIHLLEHELFLVTAVVFWWQALGSPSRLRGIWRIVYVGSAMQATMAVGIVLLTSDHVFYRHYPSLAGQHSAGALMWVVGSLLMVGLLLLVAWEWLQGEERRAVAREAYGR